MIPLKHIRKNLFDISQTAFGEIAGVTQATVSRWEAGELEPSRDEMSKIRDEAAKRGLQWDDRLFFEAPAVAAEHAV
jgi:predicted transcriptional regulator